MGYAGFSGYLLGSPNRRRLVFLVMAIVVATLVADTSLIRIYAYNSSNPTLSGARIVIFAVIVIVYVVAQYIILEFVKRESVEIRNKGQLHLKLIHRIVTTVQYVLAATIVSIILEMIITSVYSVVAMTIAIGISYSLATVMLGLLSLRFYLWFKSNKNSVVFLYGLSSSILAINAILTFAFVGTALLSDEAYVHSYTGAPNTPFIAPGSLADILNSPYVISTILSFMITWVATILILRHYSPKLKKARYWIILILPLIYFLLQFLPPFLDMLTALPQSDFVFFVYTLIFTFSKPVGGVLFGIAFWVIARTLRQSRLVRSYMIISAYGLLLLFISNQAVVLVSITFPPFGLVTVSFMGLASYLLLLGVYSSAISVSEDSKLRRSIRSFAIRESRLLDSIGMAQMEQQIQRKVIEFTKQNQDKMAEETGVQSSLTEEDVKQYLEQVIREVKMRRTNNKKGKSNNRNA